MNEHKQRPALVICVNSAWNVVNFRAGLVRALVAAGYRVVVVAPLDHPAEALAALGCEIVPVAMDRGSVSPLHDVRLFLALRRILKAIRPVALLGYTIKANVYGGLAAQSLDIPVINNIAGLGTMFLRGRVASQVARLLYRAGLARSSVVFFQNPDDQALFVRARLVRRKQARLLPGSGIDLDRFALSALPHGSHAANGGTPVVFLLVARLLRDKGIVEYVEAARLLRRSGVAARFRLVGDHDPRNTASVSSSALSEWIADGSIEYLGGLSDVRSAISEADCVVLPSYREGLPRTLLEGAAMGRPLVATDVPGCREVVRKGENGLLCRVRDADSLADAMRRMVAMGHEGRAAMGRAARRMAEERYDERLVAAAYLHALAELVTRFDMSGLSLLASQDSELVESR